MVWFIEYKLGNVAALRHVEVGVALRLQYVALWNAGKQALFITSPVANCVMYCLAQKTLETNTPHL